MNEDTVSVLTIHAQWSVSLSDLSPTQAGGAVIHSEQGHRVTTRAVQVRAQADSSEAQG